MKPLPFDGGMVPDSNGNYPAYPNGKNAWRCSACGHIGPWTETSGGWWSIRDEEENYGIKAMARPGGWPFWCSEACKAVVDASGATREFVGPTGRKRKP